MREDAAAAEFRGSGVALVVDDDPGVRKVTSDFSVVVLDMTMPGMSGQATFHALRSIRPEVPIVLSSGYDESDARRWLAGAPRVAFLKKPFARGELSTALRELLASR